MTAWPRTGPDMRRRRALVHSLAVVALSVACDKESSSTASSASSAVASAPAKPPEPPKPWYFGTWSGTFTATQKPMEMPPEHGPAPEWKRDDGGVASGEGRLEVVVDEAGWVTASASGVLGELGGSGQLEEDALTLRLLPKAQNAAAFGGVLVAKRHGKELRGTLRASGANSALVRVAEVKLSKQSGSSDGSAPKASPDGR